MAQQNKYRDIDKNVYDIISIEHLDGDDLSATLVRPNSIAPADLTFYVQSTTILKENVLYVYNFSFPYNITNSITANPFRTSFNLTNYNLLFCIMTVSGYNSNKQPIIGFSTSVTTSLILSGYTENLAESGTMLLTGCFMIS